jgi:molecular chaperone DnaK
MLLGEIGEATASVTARNMAICSIPAVGIDLGTTFSLVAHLDPAGRPWTIPNAEGDMLTPSVVLFEGSSAVVGKEAVKAAALEPERIAQFAKRDMGSSVYSKAINGEHLPPEVIQSLVLEKLKRDAEAKLGPFRKVVITVPAYFNEPRRKATQDAGRLAGLEVMDILNEPTAAAIAFGVQEGFLTPKGESKRSERLLVYDLGGGTFDVTLMEIDGKNYNVRATAGDVHLGGIDWDQRVADYVAEQFQTKFRGIDPRQNPAGAQRLLREAEDAKRALSAREATTISFEYAGQGIRVPITRQHFETITADLLERTRFTTRNLLKEAGVGWGDITRLLLVGGSSRMPMVQNMLEQESGRKADRSLSLDEAVAHGAAIYAGLLLASEAGSRPWVQVRNVYSHSLGVLGIEKATGRRRNKVMIPRNTPLPTTKRARFKTHRANQRAVEVKVVEGGDASGHNSTPVGKCVLRDLPPGLPAGTPVEVAFTYAENGRLEVTARLPDLNKEAALTIERESGLSDVLLHQWDQKLKNGQGPLKLA